MRSNELDTEQRILEAAEAEFIENGFLNAKTVNIAERAGVSHSMLHYYYRTKEKLFQKVYAAKIQVFSSLVNEIYEKDLSFFDMLRFFIEIQFDFMERNPKFPFFLLNEILSNQENRRLLLETIFCKKPKARLRLNELMQIEIEKGNICPMKLSELLLDIIFLNVSTFIVLPILQELYPQAKDEKFQKKALQERKEHIVEFVMKAVRV
jgi:AcrR family transcriptional regulator